VEQLRSHRQGAEDTGGLDPLESKRQKAEAEGTRHKAQGKTPLEVLSWGVIMRRHHEAASAAAVLWVLAGVPAAIAWTQAVVQKLTKRPR
jgi:hypothetical protein